MQGRPLSDGFGPDARIVDLLRRGTGAGVRGGVADTVARGLDGMQIHLSQGIENIRGIAQLDPVELDILTGCEMAIALVIGPRDPS